MTERTMMEIDYSLLPMHMRESVKNYIERGEPFGDFLTAVFCNNLVEAFGRADFINCACMKDWATFLYNEAPAPCWGSQGAIERWLERGGLGSRNSEIEEDEELGDLGDA